MASEVNFQYSTFSDCAIPMYLIRVVQWAEGSLKASLPRKQFPRAENKKTTKTLTQRRRLSLPENGLEI